MSSSAGGQPRTVDVPLTAPAPSVSYTLPPGVTFDVEAVYVEITTAGAGGVVTAELTISEQSGVVIAKKTQGATIPAGTTGTATWALRLTDEAATTPAGSGIQFDTYPQPGDWLEVETTSTLPASAYGDLHTRYPAYGSSFFSDFGYVFLVIDGANLGIISGDGTEIDIISRKSLNGVLRMEAWEWFANCSFIQINGDADVSLTGSLAADVTIGATGSGHLILSNLPVVNPGGSGRVWNNGGVLNIT